MLLIYQSYICKRKVHSRNRLTLLQGGIVAIQFGVRLLMAICVVTVDHQWIECVSFALLKLKMKTVLSMKIHCSSSSSSSSSSRHPSVSGDDGLRPV